MQLADFVAARAAAEREPCPPELEAAVRALLDGHACFAGVRAGAGAPREPRDRRESGPQGQPREPREPREPRRPPPPPRPERPPPDLDRKVRSLLNKLSADNAERLCGQLVALADDEAHAAQIARSVLQAAVAQPGYQPQFVAALGQLAAAHRAVVVDAAEEELRDALSCADGSCLCSDLPDVDPQQDYDAFVRREAQRKAVRARYRLLCGLAEARLCELTLPRVVADFQALLARQEVRDVPLIEALCALVEYDGVRPLLVGARGLRAALTERVARMGTLQLQLVGRNNVDALFKTRAPAARPLTRWRPTARAS
jgi:hypothetical protein